jgi:hypothetical protein
MAPHYTYPLIAVGIMTAVKVGFFYSEMDMQRASNVQIFVHMALVILSIFFTLLAYYRTPGRINSFIDDAKDGLKAGSVYALLATILVVAYYNLFDTDFFSEMQQRIFEKSVITDPDVPEEERWEKIRNTFNLSNWVLATLTGLMAMAIFYALLVALFMRLTQKMMPR